MKKFRCPVCNGEIEFGVKRGNYEYALIKCLKCVKQIKLTRLEVEALE